MEIHIWLDATDPPQGRLSVVADSGRTSGGDPRTGDAANFAGWLELLRVLSEASGSSTPPAGNATEPSQ
jgi:hypothetical protein